MSVNEQVLEAIRRFGPVSARGLEFILKLPERHTVRPAINRLRRQGEPIWNDPARNAFWFADDRKPGTTPRSRWKRSWLDSSGITGSTGLERARLLLDAARTQASVAGHDPINCLPQQLQIKAHDTGGDIDAA